MAQGWHGAHYVCSPGHPQWVATEGFAQRKTPTTPLRQQDTEYSCCPQRAFGQDSRPVWSMFLAPCSFLSPVCGYHVVWPHPLALLPQFSRMSILRFSLGGSLGWRRKNYSSLSTSGAASGAPTLQRDLKLSTHMDSGNRVVPMECQVVPSQGLVHLSSTTAQQRTYCERPCRLGPSIL